MAWPPWSAVYLGLVWFWITTTQSSPVWIEFNTTHSYSENYHWSLNHTIQSLNATTVVFNISLVPTLDTSLFWFGMINITNDGTDDLTLGNVVFNLQESGSSLCSNLFTRHQGESTNETYVPAESVSDDIVCTGDGGEGGICRIQSQRCYPNTTQSCPCSGSTQIFLDQRLLESWTYASVDPTLVPPGAFVILSFETWFHASALNLEPSALLRLETIVSFHGTNFTTHAMDIDGDGRTDVNVSSLVMESEEWMLDTTDPIPCRNQVQVYSIFTATQGLDPTFVFHQSECTEACHFLSAYTMDQGDGLVNGSVEHFPAISSPNQTQLVLSLSNGPSWSVIDCNGGTQHIGAYVMSPVLVQNGSFVSDMESPLPSNPQLCTYTQIQWATEANTLLSNFGSWYTSPLYLSLGSPSQSYIRLQSLKETIRLLQRPLQNDIMMDLELAPDANNFILDFPVDPRHVHIETLVAQPLLALRLNLDLFPALGELYFCPPEGDNLQYAHGMQIKTLYHWFQNMLGGGIALSTGYLPYDDFIVFLEMIGTLSRAYPDCQPSIWAMTYLAENGCPV